MATAEKSEREQRSSTVRSARERDKTSVADENNENSSNNEGESASSRRESDKDLNPHNSEKEPDEENMISLKTPLTASTEKRAASFMQNPAGGGNQWPAKQQFFQPLKVKRSLPPPINTTVVPTTSNSAIGNAGSASTTLGKPNNGKSPLGSGRSALLTGAASPSEAPLQVSLPTITSMGTISSSLPTTAPPPSGAVNDKNSLESYYLWSYGTPSPQQVQQLQSTRQPGPPPHPPQQQTASATPYGMPSVQDYEAYYRQLAPRPPAPTPAFNPMMHSAVQQQYQHALGYSQFAQQPFQQAMGPPHGMYPGHTDPQLLAAQSGGLLPPLVSPTSRLFDSRSPVAASPQHIVLSPLNQSPSGNAAPITITPHANVIGNVKDLTLNELRPYFNRPMAAVAKELGVCITLMKKICRRNGLVRWPHRRIRSLVNRITSLQVIASNTTNENEKKKFQCQILALRQELSAVIQNPNEKSRKAQADAKARSPSTTQGSKAQAQAQATGGSGSSAASAPASSISATSSLGDGEDEEDVDDEAHMAPSQMHHELEDESMCSSELELAAAASTSSSSNFPPPPIQIPPFRENDDRPLSTPGSQSARHSISSILCDSNNKPKTEEG